MIVNWLLKKLHARADALVANKNTKEKKSMHLSIAEEMAENRRNLAIKLIDEGRFAEAEVEYAYLVDTNLSNKNDLVSLGYVLKEQNKLQEARQILERIESEESKSDVQYMLASIYRVQELTDLAATAFEIALKIDPLLRPAYLEYCALLVQQEKFETAATVLSIGLKKFPTDIHFHTLWGNICFGRKKYNEALGAYQFATSLNPNAVEPLWGAVAANLELREYDNALVVLDALERILRDDSRVHHERGKLLMTLKRPTDALASLEFALGLSQENIDILNDKGCVLLALAELDAAYEIFLHVVEMRPNSALAHLNAGVTAWRFRDHRRAFEFIQKAEALMFSQLNQTQREIVESMSISEISNGPELEFYYAAQFPLSICHLTFGNLDAGFRAYEWRWRDEQFKHYKRKIACERWVGSESIEGKSILLCAEQGLGDTVQFVRYAQMVKDLGAIVYLEVPQPLNRLLKNTPGVDQLVIYGDALPKTDFYCPLLSLPLAFGTTLSNIPKCETYIKINEIAPGVVLSWKEKLGSSTKKRVGVVWSGNSNHTADKFRSIPFEKFSNLICRDVGFYSLQKEIRTTDQESFEKCVDIIDLSSDFYDFVETAGLIHHLDLVITVDTSVAHLAAAMGKPVWILLPHTPDWRWLLERKDSPWYPSVTLFRQSTHGNWDQVLDEVAARLKELL